jgi:hypothetical protein
MALWLAPYISMRATREGLRLGTLPPTAWNIPDAPPFLIPFLTELATPVSFEDAVAAASRHSGWTKDEATALVSDLRDAGALVIAWERGDRYDRHRLYYRMLGVHGDPQAVLASATVGLIGMGGIGTQLATHLAAAGVGCLVLTDGDRVELGNLTRQTLFTENDVGRLKVDAAEQRLKELHSGVVVEAIPRGFHQPELAVQVAATSNMVLLSADRPTDIHAWTDAACRAHNVPWSASGYIEGHGSVGPLLCRNRTPCLAASGWPPSPCQARRAIRPPLM